MLRQAKALPSCELSSQTSYLGERASDEFVKMHSNAKARLWADFKNDAVFTNPRKQDREHTRVESEHRASGDEKTKRAASPARNEVMLA